MSGHDRVLSRFWSSSDFSSLPRLSPCGRSLILFLLSHAQGSVVPGLFCLGRGGLSDLLSWEFSELDSAIAEISSASSGCDFPVIFPSDGGGVDIRGVMLSGFRRGYLDRSASVFDYPMVMFDVSSSVVWIPSLVEDYAPANPNVVHSWASSWGSVPCSVLKEAAWHQFRLHFLSRPASILQKFDEVCASCGLFPELSEFSVDALVSGDVAVETVPETVTPNGSRNGYPKPLPLTVTPNGYPKPLPLTVSLAPLSENQAPIETIYDSSEEESTLPRGSSYGVETEEETKTVDSRETEEEERDVRGGEEESVREKGRGLYTLELPDSDGKLEEEADEEPEDAESETRKGPPRARKNRFTEFDEKVMCFIEGQLRERWNDEYSLEGNREKHYNDIRLLREYGTSEVKEEVSEERIRAVCTFLKHDEFWFPNGNIRSGSKFRKKFTYLESQAAAWRRKRPEEDRKQAERDFHDNPQDWSHELIPEDTYKRMMARVASQERRSEEQSGEQVS